MLHFIGMLMAQPNPDGSDIVAQMLPRSWRQRLMDRAIQDNYQDAEQDANEESSISDSDLALRIGNGDKTAESALYSRYRSGLVLMLNRQTRDMQRAEDLVQDTLLTVITRLRDQGIDNPAALPRFIQQTAKYTFIGWLRRAGNQVELRDSFEDQTADDTSVIDNISRDRLRSAVRSLIEEMKVPRDREILHRYYVREQSKPVICEALDLSMPHFDRVINRARNRFKQLVPEDWKNDV
jgi:RNA polymerase sigma-70 factor (ECF subfamily)